MGGRGASSGGAAGVDSGAFFSQNMRPQVEYFESVTDAVDPNLKKGFDDYASGEYGGEKKAALDDQYGLSDFIDSDASKPLRIKNSPTLYRGGTISEEELNNLKVGGTLDVMHSENNLTSWTNREMVAHMYAEESKDVWGQGGSTPRDIVVVDTSKTSDAIVMPYTYPTHEVLRSKSMKYKITKIVDSSKYKGPIGREKETGSGYTAPVTYIYVTSSKR